MEELLWNDASSLKEEGNYLLGFIFDSQHWLLNTFHDAKGDKFNSAHEKQPKKGQSYRLSFPCSGD